MMTNCKNCGAPYRLNLEVCDYCGTLYKHLEVPCLVYGYNSDLITEDQAQNLRKRKNVLIDFKNAPKEITNLNQVVQIIQPEKSTNGVLEYGKYLEEYLQRAMSICTKQ